MQFDAIIPVLQFFRGRYDISPTIQQFFEEVPYLSRDQEATILEPGF